MAFALCTATGVLAQERPNVLLIIADDMGLDAPRCYYVGSQQAALFSTTPVPSQHARPLRMCSKIVIGKWHITGRQMGCELPQQTGIPDYFGLFCGGVEHYSNRTAVEDGQEFQIEGYAITVPADRAISWINGEGSPRLLWLAYNASRSSFHLPPNDLHSTDHRPVIEASVDETPCPTIKPCSKHWIRKSVGYSHP